MDLAENRFGKTWKHFLEVLKVDYNCSLADVCRDQHTTLGGMSSWMSRRGYSVKQAKADVVRDYYGGVRLGSISFRKSSLQEDNKIVTTPAYMLAQDIAQAASGIDKLVSRVLVLAE